MKESTSAENDALFKKVEQDLDACLWYEIKIVLEEFNSQIEEEFLLRRYADTLSLHGITNNNGCE